MAYSLIPGHFPAKRSRLTGLLLKVSGRVQASNVSNGQFTVTTEKKGHGTID